VKDCTVPDPHSPSNQVADFLEYLEAAEIITVHKKPFMFPVNANTGGQGGAQVASSMEGMSSHSVQLSQNTVFHVCILPQTMKMDREIGAVMGVFLKGK